MQDTFEAKKLSRELLSFIRQNPSPYHVTAGFARMLEEAGFVHLREGQHWTLKQGGSYYVTRNGSSLIAFRIPLKAPVSFQIVAAHSDSPSLRIKTDPYLPCAGHYVCLNVEKYGGAILSSWLDRPLGVAGRVMVRTENGIASRLVHPDRDLLLIPNLAIHMNRKVNEGYAYQVQKDMLPLFGDETARGKLEEEIARSIGVSPEQLLSCDLFLYNRTPGTIWGASEEYISSPKLDDLQCAFSAVRALIESGSNDTCSAGCAGQTSVSGTHIAAAAIFDNEEVGSLTAQGADSTFLEDTLKRIWLLVGSNGDETDPEMDDHGHSRAENVLEAYSIAISKSFLLSADNAHAVHPQHTDKADPVHRPLMNHGPVLKFSANQKYTTDAFSASVFGTICSRAGVPWQVFHNHSDQPGGSTLGNLSNAHVSLHAADIGLAQLSMHSSYETAGVQDTLWMRRALEEFYRSDICIEDDHVLICP